MNIENFEVSKLSDKQLKKLIHSLNDKEIAKVLYFLELNKELCDLLESMPDNEAISLLEDLGMTKGKQPAVFH